MNKFVLAAVPLLFKGFMGLVMGTCRIRRIGTEHINTLRSHQQAWIYSSWHNNTATAVWMERGKNIAMMASASEDGELIARAIAAVGNQPVRGSSSAEGDKAARDMVRALRAGRVAAVTPDGPRGPKYRLQPGVLWVASASGCPLVPYDIQARRQWVFARSWDEHKIPKPFTSVYVCMGEPFFVDKQRFKNDRQALVEEFEMRMMDNRNRCEAIATGASSV